MKKPRLAVITLTQVQDGKLDVMKESFDRLGRLAGLPLHHFVADNGCSSKARDWLATQVQRGRIRQYERFEPNVGISIGMNVMLDEVGQEYDYIMKYDPDCWPRTRDFAKKLIKVADKLREAGGFAIVNPLMENLQFPPPVLLEQDGDTVGLPGYTLQGVKIGGQCNLFPKQFWSEFRHNPYLAKGWGQDEEVAARVDQLGEKTGLWGMVRVPEIRVEHAYGDKGQEERFEEHRAFERTANRHWSYGI